MKPSEIVLGTRRSKLALAQAELVAAALSAHGCRVRLHEIVTAGDRKQAEGEGVLRDKKDWILEIEEALLRRQIDLAVHSGKDVPLEIAHETSLVPALRRAAPWDVLITPRAAAAPSAGALLAMLPPGSRIGTSSLRRKAQLLRLRPDLEVIPFRGNITTRVARMAEDATVAGIVLAQAGLERLSFSGQPAASFLPEELLPAAQQGVLVVQHLAARGDIGELSALLTVAETKAAWLAERSCIAALGADCDSAMAAFAEVRDAELRLRARVLSADGTTCLDEGASGALAAAEQLGSSVARKLLERGAAELL